MRFDAERHVGQTERKAHVRELRLDLFDAIQGPQPEFTRVFIALGNWERQQIEKNTGARQTVMFGDAAIDPFGDRNFALHRFGHARFFVFIDGQCDQRSAVFPSEIADRVEFFFAIFQVHRIDDGAPTKMFERDFQHIVLGRVDHNRNVHRRGEAFHHLVHVALFITTGPGYRNVQHVGAFSDLLLRHVDHAVPIVLEQ